MEIQWSLVLFTCLSGAGAWLLACAGLDAFRGLTKKASVPAIVVAIVLIVAGGLASATHLTHVDRIMAVLAHPAPGIFLEALLLGIDVIVAVVLLALVKREGSEAARKALGVAAVVMAVVFSYSCGSSYMMASQLAWNTVTLPLGYLGTAAATGTALWYVLCAALKEESPALAFAAQETVAGAALGAEALTFWVGVVLCGGVVPAACGFVGMKKPESALQLAVVAAAGALIGSVAFRVLMWLASVALMSLFGATI